MSVPYDSLSSTTQSAVNNFLEALPNPQDKYHGKEFESDHDMRRSSMPGSIPDPNRPGFYTTDPSTPDRWMECLKIRQFWINFRNKGEALLSRLKQSANLDDFTSNDEIVMASLRADALKMNSYLKKYLYAQRPLLERINFMGGSRKKRRRSRKSRKRKNFY